MSQKSPENARPLSPHLQVYKLPMTAKLSILHRLTGLLLSASTLILVYWLYSLAYMPESAMAIYNFFTTQVGKGVLIFVSFCFFYHFSTGIRHLIWDTGKGLDKDSLNLSNLLVILSAVVLTAITWILGA